MTDVDRVRVWIGTDALAAGETVVVAASTGEIDRRVAVPLRDGEHWPEGETGGPAELGESGAEHLAAAVLTEPLAFGVHEFTAGVRDREGVQAAGSATPVEIFVNAAPALLRGSRMDAAASGAVLTMRAG